MWTVWEVLWCISLWRKFISLFLRCKDLEFPWTPLAMALSKQCFYSVYCYFLQFSFSTRWEGGSGNQEVGSISPALALPIWSLALSRKPLPSLPQQLSSLPSLLHMFQLSLLLLQFTHPYNPHLLSLQEIQKKIWSAYSSLTVFSAAIGIFFLLNVATISIKS